MSKKNLINTEALKKLKEMVENIDFTMMETNLGNKPSHIIPMSTKDVDSLGSIWFLSNKNSVHNSNIRKDNTLELIYSKPSDMEFITVFGSAFISTDRSIIEKYYSKSDDAWFNSVDDPNITAIKVIPKDVHYWDTKNGKMTTLFKIIVGALKGKQQDLGEHGDLYI